MSDARQTTAAPATDGMGGFLARFAATASERAGEPEWLRSRREEAMARFGAAGFPSTKDEAWRATSVARLARTAWTAASGAAPASARAAVETRRIEPAHRLVFVNGRFAPDLSDHRRLPEGLLAMSLADALRRRAGEVQASLEGFGDAGAQRFGDLNAACATDGAFVLLPPGRVIDEPIHLLFVASTDAAPLVSHPWSVLVAGAGTTGTLVEEYAGAGPGPVFTNARTTLALAPGAVVEHIRVDGAPGTATHIGLFQIRLARDANLNAVSLTGSAGMGRHDVHAVLTGPGSDCCLDGLYVAGGTTHVDNHTRIVHACPHGTSHELYKGILDGHARGVFAGHVRVESKALKTNAWQANKNLLLSGDALADSTPQLEIYADDVQCRHGSTVGQLDETMMFYLRSRGLDPRTARRVLVEAFAGEILDKVRIPALHARAGAALLASLETGGGGRR
ncbi:MAG: Fe-S cluster assembly protein SufD [Acidobacteriota bacterium]